MVIISYIGSNINNWNLEELKIVNIFISLDGKLIYLIIIQY